MTNPDETLPVELLGCPTPWCKMDGGFDGGLPFVFRRRHDIFGVCCPTCSVSTPYFPTREKAIAAWNHRAAQSPPPVSEGMVEARARELLAAAIEHYALVAPGDQERADRVRAGEDSVPLYFPEALGAIQSALSSPSPGCDAETIEACAQRLVDRSAELGGCSTQRLADMLDDERHFAIELAKAVLGVPAAAIRNLGKEKCDV